MIFCVCSLRGKFMKTLSSLDGFIHYNTVGLTTAPKTSTEYDCGDLGQTPPLCYSNFQSIFGKYSMFS